MNDHSNMPALSRSRQDYLKALYALAPGGEPASTSQLARRLHVAAPSVTKMLARLADERLVHHVPRAGARLTPEGRRQALALVRRHRIIECFLVDVLGLDWAEVHDDAEVLEHHISDRVLAAMHRLAGRPGEDPHGHPIPDEQGNLPRRRLVPLADVATGGRATVREIGDAEPERLALWKRVGLVPGARVHVQGVRALEDVFEIDVDGRRLVTGSEGLAGVLVERRTARGVARRAAPRRTRGAS
jgi:DtxR family Mn-dependent transcriptional regulator